MRRHNRCGIGDPDVCGHPDCPEERPRDESTERDVEATPCHPYDEKCGGPGGPCRNHGGTFPVEKNRREALAEWDVEVLTEKEKGLIQIEVAALRAGHRHMRDVFAVIEGIIAERIAQIEELRAVCDAYGLPHSAIALDRHLSANASLTAAMDSERDRASWHHRCTCGIAEGWLLMVEHDPDCPFRKMYDSHIAQAEQRGRDEIMAKMERTGWIGPKERDLVVAEARREGADEVLLPFACWLFDRRGITDIPEQVTARYRAALRGDAAD